MLSQSQADEITIKTRVDITEVLGSNQLAGKPLIATFILSVVLILDGFDMVLLGFLAPNISTHFGLSTADIGWVLTAQQVAIACAGIIGGVLGDRLGRKFMIIVGIAVLSFATLAAPLMPNIYLFVSARIIAGFGLGVIAPNVATYLVEILPLRWKSQLTILAYASMALGGTICAVVTKALLPAYGWEGVFIFGGITPLIALLFVYFFLPESPVFLTTVSRPATQIAAALNRITNKNRFANTDTFFSQYRQATRARISDVLARDYWRNTVIIWVVLLALQFCAVALTNMGTTLLTSLGFEVNQALDAMFYFVLFGLFGTLTASAVIYRLGVRPTLVGLSALAFASASVFLALIKFGLITQGNTQLLISLTGFGLMSVAFTIIPITSQIYPAEIRSTGVGAALTISRIGAIISAPTIGLTLAAKGPFSAFLIVASLLGVTVLALMLLKIKPATSNG